MLQKERKKKKRKEKKGKVWKWIHEGPKFSAGDETVIMLRMKCPPPLPMREQATDEEVA